MQCISATVPSLPCYIWKLARNVIHNIKIDSLYIVI